MSKTVREVLESGMNSLEANDLIEWLDREGFVIIERPKGDGKAIPDYVPDDATPEQMREVIQNIGALLMQHGYEANNYLDLSAALFDMIVDNQKKD